MKRSSAESHNSAVSPIRTSRQRQPQVQPFQFNKARYTEVTIQTFDKDVPFIAIYKPDVSNLRRRVHAATKIVNALQNFQKIRIFRALGKIIQLGPREKSFKHNTMYLSCLFGKIETKQKQKVFKYLISNKIKKNGCLLGAKIIWKVQNAMLQRNLKQSIIEVRRNRLLSLIKELSDGNQLASQLKKARTQIMKLNGDTFSEQFISIIKPFQKADNNDAYIQSINEANFGGLLKKQSKRFEQIRYSSSPRRKEPIDNQVVLGITSNILLAYQGALRNYESYCEGLQSQLAGYKDSEGINQLRQVIKQKDNTIREIEAFVTDLGRMDVQLKKFTPQARFSADKVTSTLLAHDKKLQAKNKNIQGVSAKISSSRTYFHSVVNILIKKLQYAQAQVRQAEQVKRQLQSANNGQLKQLQNQLNGNKNELQQLRSKIQIFITKKQNKIGLIDLKKKWKDSQQLKTITEFVISCHQRIQQFQKEQGQVTRDKQSSSKDRAQLTKVRAQLTKIRAQLTKVRGQLTTVQGQLNKEREQIDLQRTQFGKQEDKLKQSANIIEGYINQGYENARQVSPIRIIVSKETVSPIQHIIQIAHKIKMENHPIAKKVGTQRSFAQSDVKVLTRKVILDENQQQIAQRLFQNFQNSDLHSSPQKSQKYPIRRELKDELKGQNSNNAIQNEVINELNKKIKQLLQQIEVYNSKFDIGVNMQIIQGQKQNTLMIELNQNIKKLLKQMAQNFNNHATAQTNPNIQSKIAELQAFIKKQTSTIIQVSSKHYKNNNNIEPITQKHNKQELELTIKQLIEQNRKLDSNNAQLKAQIRKVNITITQITSHNKKMQIIIAQLTAQNKQKLSKLQQMKTYYNQQSTILQNQYHERISLITSQYTQKIGGFTSQQNSNVFSIVQKNQQLLSRQLQLQEEIITLKAQIESTSSHESIKNKEQINSFKLKISQMEGQITRKNSDIQRLQNRLKQTQNSLTLQREKVNSLYAEVTNMELQLSKSHKENDRLAIQTREQVKKLTILIRTMQEQIDNKSRTLESIQTKSYSQQKTINKLEIELSNTHQQLQQAIYHCDDYQSKNSQLNSELTHLKAQFFSLQIELRSDRTSKLYTVDQVSQLQTQVKQKQGAINSILEKSKATSSNLNLQIFEAREQLVSQERRYEEQLTTKSALINRLQHKIIEHQNTIRDLEQRCIILQQNSKRVTVQAKQESKDIRQREIQLLQQQIASLQQFLSDMSHQYKVLQIKYQQQKSRFNRPGIDHNHSYELENSMEAIDKAIHSLGQNSNLSEEVKSLVYNNEKLQVSIQELQEERMKLMEKAKALPEREYVVELLFNVLLGAGGISVQSQRGNSIWNQLVRINQGCMEVGDLFSELEKFSLKVIAQK